MTDTLDAAIVACQLAKEEFEGPLLIARIADPQAARGVCLVQPMTAPVLALESALRIPATVPILTEQDDGVDLTDAVLRNPALQSRALRQVPLPGMSWSWASGGTEKW